VPLPDASRDRSYSPVSWKKDPEDSAEIKMVGTFAVALMLLQSENLSEKVINPIAFLVRFSLENKYSPSLWNSRGEQNEVEGQVVVPFEAFARENLARIKILFETSSPDGTHGLSESEVIDLLLFPRRWGTFGVGAAARLNAETADRLGTVAPGPAVGFVVEHGKWRYGFLTQTFLSDTFAETELEPILGFAFNPKWSVEMGDAQFIYDWKKGRITSIPISPQLNRVVLKSEDIHLFFRAQYNLKQETGAKMWTFALGVELIPRLQKQ